MESRLYTVEYLINGPLFLAWPGVQDQGLNTSTHALAIKVAGARRNAVSAYSPAR